MPNQMSNIVTGLVLLLCAYSILKFAFFFILPYGKRRAALDKSYAGRPYATGLSDKILLAFAVLVAVVVLADHGEPMSFLGGLFVGSVLIQLFFHAFHVPVSAERSAPEPHSPLKAMSYAIQDRPWRAWKEMAAMTAIILAGVALYVFH